LRCDRQRGFGELVGRWDEARHRAALADGRHAYFVARDGGGPIGFAIVRDWASPERVALMKRVAVSRPGLGHGRALLSRVVDAVFEETDAWRLWLGVFPENPRARRAYEAVGFRAEGIARGVAFFGGTHRGRARDGAAAAGMDGITRTEQFGRSMRPSTVPRPAVRPRPRLSLRERRPSS
jgi:diamine N-acetyltransferase